MAWRIEVATNKQATTWEDITALVDRTSVTVGGAAHEIEIDTGSGFDAADDDGVTLSIPTRRVVRVIEDATTPDTVLFRGRSIGRGLARGTMPMADANQKDVNLVDFNADLGGIPIARSYRPEETDHARIRVYLETFLQGSHRASTNLLDTYLQTTSPITLEKYTYEDATPATIFQHIIGETGKECFVTVDGELFYGPGTSTVYAASLAITDVAPDGITTFAPITPRGDEDGSEYMSGIKVIYKGRKTTTVVDSASEDAHDYWRVTHTDESIPSLAAALRRGNKLLNEHKIDEIRYECSIRLLESQVDLIKYGQTVSFRSAAAGVLSPVTVRVKRLMWEEAGPGVWFAHLELGFPKKVAGRLPPANRGPIEPFFPDVVASSAFAVLYLPSEADVGWPPNLHFAGTGDAPPAGFPGAPKVGPIDYVTGGVTGYPYTALEVTDSITGALIELYVDCAGAWASSSVTLTAIIKRNGSTIASGIQSRTFGEFPAYWSPSFLVQATGVSLSAGDVITAELAYSGPSGGGLGGPPAVPAGVSTAQYLRINGTAVVASPTDTPYPAQPVTEQVISDGSSLTYQTNYPYTPNSLQAYAGGVRIEPVQTDPTTGTFTLPQALPAGTQIVVVYQVAMGEATGATNSYTTSTAPQIVPYPLLGTGGDGSGDNILHDDGTWRPAGSSDGGSCCGDAAAPQDRAIDGTATRLSGGVLSFVQSKTAFEQLSNTISVTLDAAPTAGNLLVAWHSARSGVAHSPITPTGWTAHPSGTVDAGAHRGAMYYKVSDGTETTSAFQLTAGDRHALTVIEVAGTLALDASAENTGSGTALATGSVTPTGGANVAIVGGALIDRSSMPSVTPGGSFTELADATVDNNVEGGFAPVHWMAYRIVSGASGSYDPSGTIAGSADFGGQTIAFIASASTWSVDSPLAIDGDDATYDDDITGTEVMRLDLGASFGIVRSRVRIACATSGARTYTIKGANEPDFSDEVTLDTVDFTAVGSSTAQDIEFLWVYAGQFRYFQLDGNSESRRILTWEVFEAASSDIIVTDPTTTQAADLQTALDNIYAAAGSPALDDLSDVDTTGVADGDIIAYDSGTSTWLAVAPPSGSVPSGTDPGDLLVWDGAAWAVLPIGADDEMLYADSGQSLGIRWAAAPAGGGGGADPIADVFGTPTTAFEFDSTSTTGLTLLSPTADVIDLHTTVPGNLYIKDNASGTARCGYYASAPSLPFTAIAKISGDNVRSDYHQVALFCGQSTPGTMKYIMHSRANRGIESETGTPTSFTGAITTTPVNDVEANPLYLAMVVNSSSDWDFLYSFNGYIWQYLTEAHNAGLTPGSVGLFLASNNTNGAAAAFDFLRIWNSAKSFPGVY